MCDPDQPDGQPLLQRAGHTAVVHLPVVRRALAPTHDHRGERGGGGAPRSAAEGGRGAAAACAAHPCAGRRGGGVMTAPVAPAGAGGPGGSGGPHTARGGGAARRYLDELLRLLYPEPFTITDGGQGGGSATGTGAAHGPVSEYLLIPHARQPRLAIPVRPRSARLAAVRHLAPPQSRVARLRLTAVRTALATPGATGVAFGDRISITSPAGGDGDSFAAYLRRELGRDLVLSIHVGGPARANRKPVVEVLTGEG